MRPTFLKLQYIFWVVNRFLKHPCTPQPSTQNAFFVMICLLADSDSPKKGEPGP